jgi:hypothetical protein
MVIQFFAAANNADIESHSLPFLPFAERLVLR